MDRYTAFFVIQTVFSIPAATRNDYFWLVYNWYMASWYMYNDLFFCCGCSVMSRVASSCMSTHQSSTSKLFSIIQILQNNIFKLSLISMWEISFSRSLFWYFNTRTNSKIANWSLNAWFAMWMQQIRLQWISHLPHPCAPLIQQIVHFDHYWPYWSS